MNKLTVDTFSSSWWQSPSLAMGKQYEWVTININLQQTYLISYVVIKSANSPLPGNWILERSTDGVHYQPWQYFALNDDECLKTYGMRAHVGQFRFRYDDQVICTSFYSKNDTIYDGEMHISLVNGRPGARGEGGLSSTLESFIRAKYIKIRLQKLKSFNGNLFYDGHDLDRSDKSLTRRVRFEWKHCCAQIVNVFFLRCSFSIQSKTFPLGANAIAMVTPVNVKCPVSSGMDRP